MVLMLQPIMLDALSNKQTRNLYQIEYESHQAEFHRDASHSSRCELNVKKFIHVLGFQSLKDQSDSRFSVIADTSSTLSARV